ncbi:MAG: hypothetical protein AAGK97_02605, partial [Bacteroidota bacterium]
SKFDQAIRTDSKEELDPEVIRGFNLFMGKAACGTCHFAPTFSGLVPPSFKESEAEVLGVASTKANKYLDPDYGRSANGNVKEKADHTQHAFKTVTVRNAELTAPYMHNGAYETLEEVMDFYNKGGGQGLGFELEFQTLGADPLELEEDEIAAIIKFMESLTDNKHKAVPSKLPSFENEVWNKRKIGGIY